MIDKRLAARFALHAGRPGRASGAIGGQGADNVTAGFKSRRQGRGVLDGLSRALREKRQHRVRGIAEQSDPPMVPIRRRLALDQWPDAPFRRLGDEIANWRVPNAPIASRSRRDRRVATKDRLSRRLASRVSTTATTLIDFAAAQRVMHEMRAATEP